MKKPTNEFCILIDHIDKSWKIKKRAEFGYPFMGKDFRDLKGLGRVYSVWGVMALWDVFLSLENDFNRNTGYSVWQFQRQLPFLVDDPFWRAKRDKYREQFNPISTIEDFLNTKELFSLKILESSRA